MNFQKENFAHDTEQFIEFCYVASAVAIVTATWFFNFVA